MRCCHGNTTFPGHGDLHGGVKSGQNSVGHQLLGSTSAVDAVSPEVLLTRIHWHGVRGRPAHKRLAANLFGGVHAKRAAGERGLTGLQSYSGEAVGRRISKNLLHQAVHVHWHNAVRPGLDLRNKSRVVDVNKLLARC